MTSASFCPNCGAPRSGGVFCSNCGKPFDAVNQPPPAASSAQAGRSFSVLASAVIAAGAMVVLGAFLPWITVTAAFVGTIQRSGIDGGDGLIALGVGAVIAVLGIQALVADTSAKPPTIPVIVLGVLAAGFGALEVNNVNERIQSLDPAIRDLASVGGGLWLIIAGGVVAVLVGLVLRASLKPVEAGPDWAKGPDQPPAG